MDIARVITWSIDVDDRNGRINRKVSARMKLLRYVLVLMVGMVLNTHSWAGYVGNSVRLTWEDVPMWAGLPGDPPPAAAITDFGTKIVGSGIEFTQAGGFDVDVSNGSVRILVSCMFCYSGSMLSAFSGFRLRDADGNLPAITGVTIGLDSHFGLPPSRVSFDSESVSINLAGLLIDSGYAYAGSDACLNAPPGLCVAGGSFVQVFQPELVLNVRFAEVPEPASWGLMGIGLLGLVSSRRQKRSNMRAERAA